MVEKYKVIDPETRVNGASKYGINYQPLSDKLSKNDFGYSNIYPIVFDQKKYYANIKNTNMLVMMI